MNIIKIMPDYECYPIWISENDSIFENICIDTLDSIPENIKIKIKEWDTKFQNTFNQDYPPDSSFISVMEKEIFEKEGIEIWKVLSKIFENTFKVTYFSIIEDKLLEVTPK